MNPVLVASIIGGYFLLLMGIAWLTTRQTTHEAFYTANRQSPWYLVAFGMIGASLSGVTFISVPGEVAGSNWFYFQMVLGYLIGYFVIATVLLPLYYRLNLVSIYSYLQDRFGFWSYKSGAFFFLVSRVIGSSFRLFLVAGVLQVSFFDSLGLPFWVAVASSVILIWLYTFKGGIKTIVYTDTLQTTFMIVAVIVTIIFIKDQLDYSWHSLQSAVWNDTKSTIFNWEWQHSRHFVKQLLAGAFIAIVMTGLDQDMMQKNLTCRTLRDAQKNVFWFSIVLVFVNLLFLILGVLLYQYAEAFSIALPARTDNLFPVLAVNHFSLVAGIFFLLGITAAAYSSADSALTALTTSFCVDFLGLNVHEPTKNRTRIFVHLGFSLLMMAVILVFNAINDQSVINSIFAVAGYTYGPLLGLYSVGIFTKIQVKDTFVPLVCVLSPVLTYLIQLSAPMWLGGYQFGFELLLVNGAITILGLWLIRK